MSKTEIVEAEIVPGTEAPHQVAVQSVHPGTLIQTLITQPDIDIDKLTGLFELQLKYDNEIARKAYLTAKAEFSAMAPTIIYDRDVEFKSTAYSYATLAATMEQIRSALKQCKLNASWKLDDSDPARVRVTCFLTHDLGHQEDTSLGADRAAGAGTTGMNSLQGMKSTISYLERITLYALLGLSSRADDDDGNTGGNEVELISEDNAMQIHAKITDNDLDMEAFMRWLAVGIKAPTIEDIPADCYERVIKKIDATIKAKQAKDA